MYPKTALKILLGLIIILIIVFVSFRLYLKKPAPIGPTGSFPTAVDMVKIEEVLNKKKQGAELDSNEQQILDNYVAEQVEERYKEIEKKSDEEIKEQGYTQTEVDFILDPSKTIGEELGINGDNQSQPLTQKEIDAILNP